MRAAGAIEQSLGFDARSGWGAPSSDVTSASRVAVPRPLFDTEGAIVDTVGWERRSPPKPIDMGIVNIGGFRYVVPQSPGDFSDDPLWIGFPEGGIVIDRRAADAPEVGVLQVAKLGLAHDTVYHRAFRYTPRRHDPGVLDEVARWAVGNPGMFSLDNSLVPLPGASRSGGRPSAAERERILPTLRSELERFIPAFQRPVREARLGHDSALWLLRDAPNDSAATWVVLDPTGTPMGQVEGLPRQVLWSEGDIAFAVDADDLGVPRLVRYRIRGTQFSRP